MLIKIFIWSLIVIFAISVAALILLLSEPSTGE